MVPPSLQIHANRKAINFWQDTMLDFETQISSNYVDFNWQGNNAHQPPSSGRSDPSIKYKYFGDAPNSLTVYSTSIATYSRYSGITVAGTSLALRTSADIQVGDSLFATVDSSEEEFVVVSSTNAGQGLKRLDVSNKPSLDRLYLLDAYTTGNNTGSMTKRESHAWQLSPYSATPYYSTEFWIPTAPN